MLSTQLLMIALYIAGLLEADGRLADSGDSAARLSQVETHTELEHAAEEPTLANARWVGFTPAVFDASDPRPGVWILGPFDREERTGWITDVSTGATMRVRFRWRPHDRENRIAILSKQAATELGLEDGEATSLSIYLPR